MYCLEQISQECCGEGVYAGNPSSNVEPDVKLVNVFRITVMKQLMKVVQYPSVAAVVG